MLEKNLNIFIFSSLDPDRDLQIENVKKLGQNTCHKIVFLILTVVARISCGQQPTKKLLQTLISLNFTALAGSPSKQYKTNVNL